MLLRRQNGHDFLFRLDREAQHLFHVLHPHPAGVEHRAPPRPTAPGGVHDGVHIPPVHNHHNQRPAAGSIHVVFLLFHLRPALLAEHPGNLSADGGERYGKQNAPSGPVKVKALVRQTDYLVYPGGGDQGEHHVLLRLRQAEIVQNLRVGGPAPHAQKVEVKPLLLKKSGGGLPLVPVHNGRQQLQPGQCRLRHQRSTSSS